MGYIYQHVNKINGKRYIGQTIQKPEKRWQNGKRYTHNIHFWNAIQKYGWDNFDHYIIGEYPDEELDNQEIYFIAMYRSNDPQWGYNQTSGGNNNTHFSKELKDRLSKAHKHKILGPGKQRKNYNKYDKLKHGNTSKRKKCICIETNKVYESAAAASRELGCGLLMVAQVCRGENPSIFGYHFKYIEEEK